MLQEGVCILSGLGYNGVVDGEHKWDACANMKVWVFETTPLFGGTISSFNINTNAWAARSVKTVQSNIQHTVEKKAVTECTSDLALYS